jgi:hypothetical protein
MKNPKTTVAGYLVLVGALFTFGGHLLGHNVGAVDLQTLAMALAAAVGLWASALTGNVALEWSDLSH